MYIYTLQFCKILKWVIHFLYYDVKIHFRYGFMVLRVLSITPFGQSKHLSGIISSGQAHLFYVCNCAGFSNLVTQSL